MKPGELKSRAKIPPPIHLDDLHFTITRADGTQTVHGVANPLVALINTFNEQAAGLAVATPGPATGKAVRK